MAATQVPPLIYTWIIYIYIHYIPIIFWFELVTMDTMLRCLVESSHIPMIFPCFHSNYGPLTLKGALTAPSARPSPPCATDGSWPWPLAPWRRICRPPRRRRRKRPRWRPVGSTPGDPWKTRANFKGNIIYLGDGLKNPCVIEAFSGKCWKC